MVSSSTRNQIAEIRNRNLRAYEEMDMLKAEMLALLTNLELHHEQIMITLMKKDLLPLHGMLVEVIKYQEEVCSKYHRARTLFAGHLNELLPPVPDHLTSQSIVIAMDEIINEHNVPSDSEEELSDYEN